MNSKVHHYTSDQGLINILKTKSLWATHFEYLNDQSEYKHAKEIIINVVKTSKNLLVQKHSDILEICLNQIYTNYDIYTCSFSQNPNQLSQWRAYCPKHGGFSIGFDVNKLIKLNGENFYKCIYDQELKEKLITPVIEEFCENVQKLIDDVRLTFSKEWEKKFSVMKIEKYPGYPQKKHFDLEKNHIFIKYELAKIAAQLKDVSFQDENEYRFIYIGSKSEFENIEFRSNQSLIIPYRILKIENDSIKNIVIGPSLNQIQNLNSINLLKESLKMNFEIITSDIPYRGW